MIDMIHHVHVAGFPRSDHIIIRPNKMKLLGKILCSNIAMCHWTCVAVELDCIANCDAIPAIAGPGCYCSEL